MRTGSRGRWLPLALLVLVTGAVALSVAAGPEGGGTTEGENGDTVAEPKNKPCGDCHTAWEPPEIALLAPREVTVDSRFTVYGVVLNHGTPARLDDENDDGYPYPAYGLGLALGEDLLVERETGVAQPLGTLLAGSSEGVLWLVAVGGTPGETELVAELTGRAEYLHNTPQEDDYRLVAYGVSAPVTVRQVPLRVSTPLVLLPAGGSTIHEVVLWSEGATLANVTLGPATGEVQVGLPADDFVLAPGRPVSVVLELSAARNGTSLLPIRWVDEQGEPGVFNLTLIAQPSSRPAPDGIPRLFGRVSGMLGLGGLALTATLGGALGLRPRLNRLLNRRGVNARQRISSHCWFSLGLCGLGLLHGVWLVLGPYSGLAIDEWGRRLWLGWAIALAFGLLGLHGYFQRWYIRRRSYREWSRVHQGLAATALGLLALHATLVGTDKQLVYGGLAIIGAAGVWLGGQQWRAHRAPRAMVTAGGEAQRPAVAARPKTAPAAATVAVKPTPATTKPAAKGPTAAGAPATVAVAKKPVPAATKPAATRAPAKPGATPEPTPPSRPPAPAAPVPSSRAPPLAPASPTRPPSAPAAPTPSTPAAPGLVRPLRVRCPRCKRSVVTVRTEGEQLVECIWCSTTMRVRPRQ